MKKEILILSILFLVAVLILMILVFLDLPSFQSPTDFGLGYFTDIEELYFSFTDSMRNEVDSHLQLLNCEPTGYSDDNSYLCFICDDIQPCFGYGWVDMGQGRARNPTSIPYIAGVEEFEVRIADFCRDGLASELNCQKLNGDFLECGKVKFVATNKEGIIKCSEVKLVLKEEVEFEDFVEDFCKLKNEELGETIEISPSCGKYIMGLGENREIIIVEK